LSAADMDGQYSDRGRYVESPGLRLERDRQLLLERGEDFPILVLPPQGELESPDEGVLEGLD